MSAALATAEKPKRWRNWRNWPSQRRVRKTRKKPEIPLTRRFHRLPGEKLRYWERAIALGLCSREPSRRLWATVLADALYIIYRTKHRDAVEDEVRWLFDRTTGEISCFEDLALVFDIDPDDIRRDVRRDIENARIKARITCLPKSTATAS